MNELAMQWSPNVVAISLSNLPPFDWMMAIQVGGLVCVAAVVIVGLAIATPGIAMVAAGSMMATAVSIAGVALLVGTAGGLAAGFVFGHAGEIERQENIQRVASVSRQLQIRFLPTEDQPDRAADFQCTIVTYQEADLNAHPPKVDEDHLHVSGSGSEEFYAMIEQKIGGWFAQDVLADRDDAEREVTVYMQPYPGDGIYERIIAIVRENAAGKPYETRRVNRAWQSALP